MSSDRLAPSFASSVAQVAALLGVDVEDLAQTPSQAYYIAGQLRKPLRECTSLPDEAFAPLMAAAVYHPDPSFCRWFVDPAVRLFGRRRVLMALVGYLQTGTDAERYGASRAWYWAGAPLDHPDAASLLDVLEAWAETSLVMFAETSDPRMRHHLLDFLPAKRDYYPDRLRDLFDSALTVASTLPDARFRNWVKVSAAVAGH